MDNEQIKNILSKHLNGFVPPKTLDMTVSRCCGAPGGAMQETFEKVKHKLLRHTKDTIKPDTPAWDVITEHIEAAFNELEEKAGNKYNG